MRSGVFGLYCVLTVLVLYTEAAYVPQRHFHDYVKDGRFDSGPFPSSLKNMPYFCYQAPSKGPCDRMYMVWFFDIVRRECMPMMYSGCGGNENRFNSKAECNSQCQTRSRI